MCHDGAREDESSPYSTLHNSSVGKFGSGTTARSLKETILDTVARGTSSPNTRKRPGMILANRLGRQIGTDASGLARSRMRVVLNPNDKVKSAIPAR